MCSLVLLLVLDPAEQMPEPSTASLSTRSGKDWRTSS